MQPVSVKEHEKGVSKKWFIEYYVTNKKFPNYVSINASNSVLAKVKAKQKIKAEYGTSDREILISKITEIKRL